jgi:hypothetical protein
VRALKLGDRESGPEMVAADKGAANTPAERARERVRQRADHSDEG